MILAGCTPFPHLLQEPPVSHRSRLPHRHPRAGWRSSSFESVLGCLGRLKMWPDRFHSGSYGLNDRTNGLSRRSGCDRGKWCSCPRRHTRSRCSGISRVQECQSCLPSVCWQGIQILPGCVRGPGLFVFFENPNSEFRFTTRSGLGCCRRSTSPVAPLRTLPPSYLRVACRLRNPVQTPVG